MQKVLQTRQHGSRPLWRHENRHLLRPQTLQQHGIDIVHLAQHQKPQTLVEKLGNLLGLVPEVVQFEPSCHLHGVGPDEIEKTHECCTAGQIVGIATGVCSENAERIGEVQTTPGKPRLQRVEKRLTLNVPLQGHAEPSPASAEGFGQKPMKIRRLRHRQHSLAQIRAHQTAGEARENL